ncbi:General stress protein CsbD [Hyphomicrobium sp. 1Nfss2.1]|uniref:hypothetical protein n=1 Tax=Hyphomicrobium sp. 1Nfss2.1 TaxID=3413936 RepID=UPI003C7A0658
MAETAHATAGTNGPGMRGEIAAKWGKFSSAEIAALKNKDDLVAQVQTKYQLEKAQAEKDVDAFAKGRQL